MRTLSGTVFGTRTHHVSCSIVEASPFYFSKDERRESGNTACRSLADTATAFHAWCDRNRNRYSHPMAEGQGTRYSGI